MTRPSLNFVELVGPRCTDAWQYPLPERRRKLVVEKKEAKIVSSIMVALNQAGREADGKCCGFVVDLKTLDCL